MIEKLNKPANLLIAGYSYLKSNVTGNPVISRMPVSISTELTNNCNLNCPQCSSGSGLMERERGFMDLGIFKKVMNELDTYLYQCKSLLPG